MWPDWGAVGSFSTGVGNAVASNCTTVIGVDRETVLVQGIAQGEGGAAYTAGQDIGEVISVAQGVAEFALVPVVVRLALDSGVRKLYIEAALQGTVSNKILA